MREQTQSERTGEVLRAAPLEVAALPGATSRLAAHQTGSCRVSV